MDESNIGITNEDKEILKYKRERNRIVWLIALVSGIMLGMVIIKDTAIVLLLSGIGLILGVVITHFVFKE